jgi:hypothetical protein
MNDIETTLVIKILSGLLLISASFYLLLLRPWRPRRMLDRMLPSIDLLFVIGLTIGVASLYEESLFPKLASALVQATGLPESAAAVDQRIADLEQLPQRLWDDLVSGLGWGDVDEPALAELAPAPIDDEPGMIEGSFIPAITSAVELLLRSVVYWSALIVLLVCQVMRLAAAALRRLRDRATLRRERELATLDGRVAAIEARLSALPAQAG